MPTSLCTVALAVLLCTAMLTAQDTTQGVSKDELEDVKGTVESMNETLVEFNNIIEVLRRIKFSGYYHWQFSSTNGAGGIDGTPTSGPAAVGSFAGGAFAPNSSSRFQVRRGRLKLNIDTDLSQYVLQIDVTQSGVGMKDAYVSVKEPWTRAFTLTAGIFNRPFGYELAYTSNLRESPERSRLYQTLFPGERDLGFEIQYQPELGFWSRLNIKAGLFNGMGPAAENDNARDFIGRAGFQLPFEEHGFGIDFGASLYAGSVRSNSRYIYSSTTGGAGFAVDSVAGNAGKTFSRTYYGADVQAYYDLPGFGGMTLRAEYILGEQPGTAASHFVYNSSVANTPLYRRDVAGYYLYYVFNIGLSNQFLAKYDQLDPNTKIPGDRIGSPGSLLNLGDIAYSTVGVGWVYHWDMYVKFMVFYERIINESVNAGTTTAALAPFANDVKDDVLTFRMQYRFP